ncbi:MAG: long-chain fatty acid--CoA ligase [Alphaproteobacteria bacterium]|nr:long-chain fatty acid--CoA ligase [Alphaproteobacteria bacterium]
MTVANWVEKWALICPDKTAVNYEGEDISYSVFSARIKNTAAVLEHSLGLKRGDRVAYLGQNHPVMLYLLFACARTGMVFVPLNWRLAPSEHLHMLTDCAAAALFIDAPYQAQCEPLQEKLANCQLVAMEAPARSGWRDLSLMRAQSAGQDRRPAIDLEDPLLVVFTSGTTGFPKGAVLSHIALETNALNSIHMHDMTFEDVILTILPMFHVGGLNIQTTAAFSAGATVLLQRNFDAGATLEAIDQCHPSLTIILPAHMRPLQEHDNWLTTDFSSLRSVTTGSCVIPDSMTSFWHGRKIPLLQVYGSSETCPIAIHQRTDNAFNTAGSIGFPAKHCAVRIIDDAGKDCDIDQAGEILISGKNIISRYWNDSDATDKALKDGWFYSGDIGYQDSSGCYHFVDRKKDMIISGGENIYPAELELVLGHHPKIQEIAVVGRPDERWGEVVVAFIVPVAGAAPSGEEILEWLSDRLGRYKHPREFHFIDAMPRNEMRKIQKDMLRDIAG